MPEKILTSAKTLGIIYCVALKSCIAIVLNKN